MTLGFLAVFAEPGEKVTLEEFQDWYNNEHVPLRMDHLDSFLTGARYSAADSKKPSWAAFYDISSPSVFSHESYTCLRANRSPREGALVVRLEELDRRCLEAVSDSGEPSPEISTSFKPENPTQTVVTEGYSGEGVEEWTKASVEKLKGIEGWVRTKVSKVIEGGALKTGLGIGKGPEAQVVPEFLAVHEFTQEFSLLSPELKAYAENAAEFRAWSLYKAYPKNMSK